MIRANHRIGPEENISLRNGKHQIFSRDIFKDGLRYSAHAAHPQHISRLRVTAPRTHFSREKTAEISFGREKLFSVFRLFFVFSSPKIENCGKSSLKKKTFGKRSGDYSFDLCASEERKKYPPAAWLLLFSLLSGALEKEKSIRKFSSVKFRWNFIAVSVEKRRSKDFEVLSALGNGKYVEI